VRIVFAEATLDVATRWRNGEADVLDHFHGKETLEAAGSVFVPPQMLTLYLGFNATRPPFDQPLVRRAVAHAIDRTAIVEAWDARADPAGTGGLIGPTLPAHSPRAAPPFDLDRARELLAEAGHAAGLDVPTLDIVSPSPFGSLAPLVDQLTAIGIEATLRTETFAEMLTAAGTADAFVWGWIADYPDPAGMMTLFEMFPYLDQDDGVRQLLQRARALRDRDERLRVYREADRLWVGERAALVPLAYGRDASYARPWIDGVWKNAVTGAGFADFVVRRDDPT
jgi:peptide/nickel transport system substrate-binding protein